MKKKKKQDLDEISKALNDIDDYNVGKADYVLRECVHSIKGSIDQIYFGLFDYMSVTEKANFLEQLKEQADDLQNVLYKSIVEKAGKISVLNSKLVSYNNELISLKNHLEDKTEELRVKNEQYKKVNRTLLDDLELARKIQLNIIPHVFPDIEGVHFSARYFSIKRIGGDLYDVIQTGDTICALLIADVCGHGTAAALVTIMLKVLFHTYAQQNLSSNKICEKINDEMCKFLKDSFITMFVCIIDTEKKKIFYTNAAHPPPVLFNEKSNEIKELLTQNCYIAISEGIEFIEDEMEINDGDKVIFYTDGITEAKNEETDLYDYNRLLDYIKSHKSLKADSFIDGLFNDIDSFCQAAPITDDRALILFEYTAS